MKFIKVTVDQYGKTFFEEEMPIDEVLDAIDWLKEHNGNAPKHVHHLITALEMGCSLVKAS